MQPFQNLMVWEKSHSLTLQVYSISETTPKSESFGLVATLRRSSAQLTMKIAEACGQDVSGDFIHHLRQARGISMEAEYQLLLARDLHFLKEENHATLQKDVVEVRRMLSGRIKIVSV